MSGVIEVNSLDDIVRANLCVGCGICETISGHSNVKMEIDLDGFYRPAVRQCSFEVWQKIKSICPGIAVRQDANLHPSKLERLWGPIKIARVGYSTDPQIRWQASSGGAISAILVYLLEAGQVDYVVQIGVSGSDPYIASVCTSRTRQEVMENAGSWYAPTAPLVSLGDLLGNENARFAFVGKPCDVMALRAYVKLYPKIRDQVVAFISFFCAGVPSLLATYDIVQAMRLKRDDVAKFRYRGYGWPGRTTAIDFGGQEHSMEYSESWGEILNRKLQFRCKICPDGIGELADIVCGDAWHTKDGYPDFEERPGQSLILVRTDRGQELLGEMEANGYLETTEFDLNDLETIQPYQKARRQAIASRLLALWLMRRPLPKYEGFYLMRNAISAGPLSFLRQTFGMLRRLRSQRFLSLPSP
jgi:coenzyme F420 hydrogenase subunit beta